MPESLSRADWLAREMAAVQPSVLAWRVLLDGQILTVAPLLFGARLTVGHDWTGWAECW